MKNLFFLLLKLAALFVVVIGLALGWTYWQMKQREKQQGVEAATAETFARFTGPKGPPAGAADQAQARYRKGHLLTLNAEVGSIDGTFYTLPPALRATDANDVGTEVWITWAPHVLGKYTNGGLMVQTDCDVVVYDLSRNAIVAREHIVGDDPPPTVVNPRGSREGWDKPPMESVVKFLAALPAH